MQCVCACYDAYPESAFSHELTHELGVTVRGEQATPTTRPIATGTTFALQTNGQVKFGSIKR